MRIDQLRAFANSADLSWNRIALTREAARALVVEHDREIAASQPGAGFQLPEERANEGRFSSRLFASIASMRADEARIAEDSGMFTRAGVVEAGQ